jgi:WD40 repeat protein
VSVSYDDTVKIWAADDDDWICTDTLTGHTSTVWGAAFNTAGDMLGENICKSAILVSNLGCEQ